ncbi:MAG: YjbE family putative metal transport protein [Alphaproteobacteria bacterium]
MSELTALFSVIMIDIVLACDNVIVVATAASGLPPAQRRKVIYIGVSLALIARIAFALLATQLLAVIGLLFAGGLLLLWVAWKMWREIIPTKPGAESDAGPTCSRRSKTFRSAVIQVAVADISMSLDNVLAVAGAARNEPLIMAFGLALSVALMAVAAGYVARLIERHPWIAYVGLIIIVIVAFDMIREGGMEVIGAAAGIF